MKLPRLSNGSRALFRGLLVPTLLLCVSLPSWTASLTKEGYSIDQARTYYADLNDEERHQIHERYERFSSLTQEERDDLRLRGRNLARISKESESKPMPLELATELEKLSPRDRRRFQQSLLKEELREKGREFLSNMPEQSRKELKKTKGARERAAFMRRYKHANVMRIIDEMIRRVGKRLDVPVEETQRILSLRKGERLRAFLELNVGLTEEELLRTGLPFGINPEQWEEWRKLSAEDFFAAVVQHRESKRRERRTRQDKRNEDRIYAEPEPARLAALVQLLQAVRKRPRDFVELADLKRGSQLRLELGKRKRALCLEAIESVSLIPHDRLTEVAYLNSGAFFALVRSIIDEAGGSARIEEWSGLELRRKR